MKLRSLFQRSQPQYTGAPVTARAAQALIAQARNMRDLDGMVVQGHLKPTNNRQLTALPANLCVDSLDVSGCTGLQSLPQGLRTRRINVSGCTALSELPPGLRCYELIASHTLIRTLPSDLQVEYRLDLEACTMLGELPAGLKVGSLILRECTALTSLPEGLDVSFLDIAGCTRLESWPQTAAVRIGRLNARGCVRLQSLPAWLTQLAQLDVSGCVNLSDLPPTLTVTSWLDLANTQISWLPASARGAQLRWRGVPIDARIAFQPETITASEVLDQSNAELRRVLLERMGYDAFLNQAHAQTLDCDRDKGGERRLLKVELAGDEPLVCVSVICPSTDRQYLIRVPPTMRSCRQAVAWVAGFDNPDDYRPLVET
jgi:uncharacterized protein DUF6745